MAFFALCSCFIVGWIFMIDFFFVFYRARVFYYLLLPYFLWIRKKKKILQSPRHGNETTSGLFFVKRNKSMGPISLSPVLRCYRFEWCLSFTWHFFPLIINTACSVLAHSAPRHCLGRTCRWAVCIDKRCKKPCNLFSFDNLPLLRLILLVQQSVTC